MRPVLRAEQLPSLTRASRFHDGLMTFAARATSGRVQADEITPRPPHRFARFNRRESPFLTSTLTNIFTCFLRFCGRCFAQPELAAFALYAIPSDLACPCESTDLLARPGLWARYAQLRVLGRFAGKFREAVDREGFVTPDGTLGIGVTGALDETMFHAIARNTPQGT